jgi:hypothetical protein
VEGGGLDNGQDPGVHVGTGVVRRDGAGGWPSGTWPGHGGARRLATARV